MKSSRNQNDVAQITTFKNLPLDVLLNIFSRLSVQDIMRLNAVDRELATFTETPSLWEQKMQEYFPAEHNKITTSDSKDKSSKIDWYGEIKKAYEIREFYNLYKFKRPPYLPTYFLKFGEERKKQLFLDVAQNNIKNLDSQGEYTFAALILFTPVKMLITKGRCSQDTLNLIFNKVKDHMTKQNISKFDLYDHEAPTLTMLDFAIICNKGMEPESLDGLSQEELEHVLETMIEYNKRQYAAFFFEYCQNNWQWTDKLVKALCNACQSGSHEMVEFLLKTDKITGFNADIWQQCFARACVGGQLDVVKLLLAHPLAKTVKVDIGMAIMQAINADSAKLVEHFIDYKLGEKASEEERRAMMTKCLFAAIEDDSFRKNAVFDFLINNGVDLNKVSQKNHTPLYFAAYHFQNGGRYVDFLYNRGARKLPDFSEIAIPNCFPKDTSHPIVLINSKEKDISKCIMLGELKPSSDSRQPFMSNVVFNISMMHAIEHARRLLVQNGNAKKAAALGDLLTIVSDCLNQPFKDLITLWKGKINSVHSDKTNAALISEHQIFLTPFIAGMEKSTGIFSKAMSVFSDKKPDEFKDIGISKTEKFINQLYDFSELHQRKLLTPKQEQQDDREEPSSPRPG